VPAIQVGHGFVIGVKLRVPAVRSVPKTEKDETIGGNDRFDRWNAGLVFLNVEHEVAALAGRKKIGRPRILLHQAGVIESQTVLAALPDGIGGMAVAPLGNERARRGDALPGQRAAEPDPHESTGSQHAEKHASAFQRIAKMMKHAHHLDDIERLPEAFELEDVRTAELDIGNAEFARLSLGKAETRRAQVDRQDLGVGMKLRGFDRMPSRSPRSRFQVVPDWIGKPNVGELNIHPVGK
jgi:hypothetical protein